MIKDCIEEQGTDEFINNPGIYKLVTAPQVASFGYRGERDGFISLKEHNAWK